MPTPYKTTENMTKHLTVAERDARQAAERELRRGRRPTLKAPAWLSEDALKIFDTTKRRLRDFSILESSDADLLALYSDALSRYQEAVKSLDGGPDSQYDSKAVAAAQAWSRLALSYAEKLGISATGRARLARKKAEQQAPDDMEQLLQDVTNYVNGEQ